MAAAQRAKTILVVEDNPDVQILITHQLKDQDFKIVLQPNGRRALDWLAENECDLVLLDLMLPGIDGLEVCRRIRAEYSATALPVLMLSALGGRPEDRVKGLQAGANDFMAKPYDEDELVARIRVLLNVKGEREHIEDVHAQYTARALRARAKLDPELLERREYRHAVVMFADLRGFTRLTSNTQPGDVLRMLDEFFEAMMGIVDKHGGVVLDLIGDELLAAFNVPNDTPFFPSHLAIQAAVEMQNRFKGLQQSWREMDLDVGLGIGIHQGEVLLGNIGGAELKRYTVLGEVVNIAHRLVELAGDGEIVISSEVHDDLDELDESVPVRQLPHRRVSLKGLKTPRDVYRLMARTPTSGTPQKA